MVLFTAIFSSISIIEDRREGFLQGVLVSPIPRWSMILGKVLGGTIVAVAQGLIFLLLGLMLPIVLSPLSAVELVAVPVCRVTGRLRAWARSSPGKPTARRDFTRS